MLLVNVVPQVGELSKAMGTLASRGSAGLWEQIQMKLLKIATFPQYFKNLLFVFAAFVRNSSII